MPDLLLELFSEEIPARMQARAAADLARLVTEGLAAQGLTHGAAQGFATPRRLTLHLADVAAESPTKEEERRGPRADAPEKAIDGFCRGAGVARADLVTRDTPKGAMLFAQITTPGRPAADIIGDVVPAVVQSFPWPKSMRWGAGDLRWVRPLTAILCTLDGVTVPFEVGGISAGAVTFGHRMHAPGAIMPGGFDDYKAQLHAAHVMLDPTERAALIEDRARALAAEAGLELIPDPALLAEVTGLVEWPVVLIGRIEDRFLELPPEVLQTSMREHQKFFSLRNPATGRIEGFATVANVDTADGGATILAGNQKVLSARLSDAAFFWENDLRVARAGAAPWIEALADVTFQRDLGSEAARIARIAALARTLAPELGADAALTEEAAQFAKADLVSQMVYEFPELQGLMGRYYAQAAGKPEAVARAAQDHYAPLGPADPVPTAPVSVAVALADKIDKLAGFWAIGEKPTGSKDPFALRRAALGVIRLILENRLRLPLLAVIGQAHGDADASDLLGFVHDRLKVYLRDRGLPYDVIDAVLAQDGADDIGRVVARAEALRTFL
ncbi:MAG: glycine--tRNA ligase subunit beta, partial [Pseudomonadota bacterium]